MANTVCTKVFDPTSLSSIMSEAEKNAELFFSQKPVRKRETDRDQDIGLHKGSCDKTQ
jgi:hypothetical protein